MARDTTQFTLAVLAVNGLGGAVIAAIVASGFGLGRQFFLLGLYNVCFLLPLLLIIATLAFAGDRAQDVLTKARRALQRYWPTLLAGLALLAFQHLVHRR